MPITSDSSDSEDDAQMQQFLEAADPMLLTNSMYQQQNEAETVQNTEALKPVSKQGPTVAKPTTAVDKVAHLKSERYLPDDVQDHSSDLHLPQAVQAHISKKVAEIIAKQVEFSDRESYTAPSEKEKTTEGRLKLLSDADCYVQCYDAVQEDALVPVMKPKIVRRKLSECDEPNEAEKLQLATISGEHILAGLEVKHWHHKQEHPNKVFRYKAKKGKLREQPAENEFSALRRKNNWCEEKIKKKIKSYLQILFTLFYS